MGNRAKGEWRQGKNNEVPDSIPIYVTNFPKEVTAARLWKIGIAYGTVCDVFMGPRLTKRGKRYAFIRYIKVKDEKAIARGLCTEWIGSYHLFATVALFGKDDPKPHTKPFVSYAKRGTQTGIGNMH